MRIETICTGDELLTGLTADTNSGWFQTLLLERLGARVRRSVVVGDDRGDIVEALNAAAARCEVVLVSGGLGPTADDLTAECAASAAGVALVENGAALAHLTERFQARGVVLTPNNRRVALVPEGSEVVLNREGTAPMFVQRRGPCELYYVPGVPHEYRFLVETEVLPRIERRAAGAPDHFRALRVLKTIGVPESHLDEQVRPLVLRHPQVTFGFRTQAPENHLKLLAVGVTQSAAYQALAAAEEEARQLLGAAVFGSGDQTLASVVGDLLRARNETVATAESCTGGLVSAQLTDPPGASVYFLAGAATYQPSSKTLWAEVPAELIEAHTAVSEPVARAMAAGIRRATGADWGLSTTGYAGPSGGDERNPPGTVFIGLCGPGADRVERRVFHGDRHRVRRFATWTALDLLRQALRGR